jgi:CubicO group peptidase (beta-lactamase class C family)
MIVAMDRRAFLGAASAVVLASACGRRRRSGVDESATVATSVAPSSVASSSEPDRSPGTSVSPTSSSSTAAPSPTTTGARGAWTGADFAGLDRYVKDTAGRALMILQGGAVVHEWYRDGRADYARDIASAQKSVLSLLVGIAIDRGLLTLDSPIDSVLGTGWANGDSSTITVFNLLTMTSGLDNSLRVIARPGAAWRYNNAFSPLFDVIQTVTSQSLNEVATQWLFEPIGATGAEFRRRPNAGAATAIGLVCTAAQLAAVGEMVLGHQPKQTSQAWLDRALTPSQTYNPAYGLLWWLNGQARYLVPEGLAFNGSLIPSAPADLVAALGKDDQKLYVSRADDLVVVRLGDKADPTSKLALSDFDNQLWARLRAERDR